MVEIITSVNKVLNDFIWGVPAIVCIIGVGLYIAIRTKAIQIRKFGYIKRRSYSFPGGLYSSCGNSWNR